jgi:hypothetical protein
MVCSRVGAEQTEELVPLLFQKRPPSRGAFCEGIKLRAGVDHVAVSTEDC